MGSGSDDEFSEDEDEHGLDRLELEEGDMEEIDEQLEMDKVGRLHQKVLLDEDQADIRLFQERFLEDGDLHTDNKRQRQFKWKGLDEDIEVAKPDSDGEEEELGIDETWRLETMERKKWFKENCEQPTSVEIEPESQFFKLAQKALAKASSASEDRQETSEDIVGGSQLKRLTGPLQPLQTTTRDQRSSFLARGCSSLEKMALFTRKDDCRTGSGAKKSTRNFVFAAVSPEKNTAVEELKLSMSSQNSNLNL